MTNEQYREAGLRTWIPLANKMLDVKHATLGMISEVGELADMLKRSLAYGKPFDRINAIEEIGDIYWYVNLLEHTLGFPAPQQANYDFSLSTQTVDGLLLRISRVVGTMSSEVAMARDVNDLSVTGLLEVLQLHLEHILYCVEATPQEAKAANIAKLAKRFPEKFTQELAINRDHAAERVVLEAHVGS